MDPIDHQLTPEGKTLLSQIARHRARDKSGHFLSTPLQPPVSRQTPATSDIPPAILISPALPATNTPSSLPEVTTTSSSPDEPLVSVSINNPFKKFFTWFYAALRKQTADFDFKFKLPIVPVIAVIIVLFGASLFSTITSFINLGQLTQLTQLRSVLVQSATKTVVITPIPSPILISRTGILKATYAISGITTTTPVPPNHDEIVPSLLPHRSSAERDEGGRTLSGYVLVTAADLITYLQVPKTLDLTPYLNQSVLITGSYNQSKNTLTITRSSDLKLLP